MVYRMIFNQTAYFGRGAIKEIPGVARSHGFTKAFIVTDPVLLETGTVKKVTDVLDEAGMPYEVFDNVKPNPPVECIQDGVAKFAASGADFLIGLGGGSPQDTCKGIGIVTANPEFADVLSLEGVADTKNPSVPIFGVPTTAGTASETTINYVITDTANKRKFVAVDPHDIPIVAFVDPDLTDSMPRGLKVATGLDALLRSLTASGKPLLGVCLGCQILLERSEENDTETLGILPGFCRRFDPALTDGGEPLRIPHMGWNALHVRQADCPLFDGIEDGTPFYFVHSYYPEPDPALTLASCRYGSEFAAVFGRPGLWAAQFHPEKSGPAGLRLLRNFYDYCHADCEARHARFTL